MASRYSESSIRVLKGLELLPPLPPGSAEQARSEVFALKDAIIAQCRRSGGDITSEGNFNYVWNQTSNDEQTLQGARPRFREDVAVSL